MCTIYISIFQEEPYLSLKKAEKGENLTGNDRYEGFCKEMADKIAQSMNIKCMHVKY